MRIDLDDLIGYAEVRGLRPVILATVHGEIEARLVGALTEAFGRTMGFHQIRKRELQIRRRLVDLLRRLESVDPPVPMGSIPAARDVFKRHPRDLSAFSVRVKDPIPDPNDVRILMQMRSLGTPGHLVTRDGHFLGYADVIWDQWKVGIHDARRLPLLIEEWRTAVE